MLVKDEELQEADERKTPRERAWTFFYHLCAFAYSTANTALYAVSTLTFANGLLVKQPGEGRRGGGGVRDRTFVYHLTSTSAPLPTPLPIPLYMLCPRLLLPMEEERELTENLS